MKIQETAFLKTPDLKKKTRTDTAYMVHSEHTEFCCWTSFCVGITEGSIGMMYCF